MEKYLNMASIVFGAIGGVVVGALGGMDIILHALIALVIADYFTGLAKAWKLKELSSEVGFTGLIKKAFIFVIVAVSVEVGHVLGDTIPLREVVIMFYLSNEGISLLENASEFIKMPDALKEAFQQIRSNGNSDKGNGGEK